MLTLYLARTVAQPLPIRPPPAHPPTGSDRPKDKSEASGLTREALYKALRADAQPRFDTISRVCVALGVRLVAESVHTRSKRIAGGRPV